ncbi:HTH_Tnp_Tc3_2 domain-containing protein [Trichonephila clavipes]|nr:HTH_Tnp_Tc3_2 domain-containing protein [Trichonephila clavipes]
MPCVSSTNIYQHISDFDKGQIVAYRECGLSQRSIAASVGRDPMVVSRTWNRWVQNGNTERRTGSQRPFIPSSREERHVTRTPLMDRTPSSRALSQELGRLQDSKCLHEHFDDV